MSELAYLLCEVWNLFHVEFDLFGHTLSFAQVFAFTIVGDILLSMVWEVFSGG